MYQQKSKKKKDMIGPMKGNNISLKWLSKYDNLECGCEVICIQSGNQFYSSFLETQGVR